MVKCVYFPTDSQLQNFDETDINETLYEVENIMENYAFNDIIIGGDMNWEMSRNTGFSRSILLFPIPQ